MSISTVLMVIAKLLNTYLHFVFSKSADKGNKTQSNLQRLHEIHFSAHDIDINASPSWGIAFSETTNTRTSISERLRIILKLTILAKFISVEILRDTPQTKSLYPLNRSMRKMWTIARPKRREISEFKANNTKMHGSTNAKISKLGEYCVAIGRRNFMITNIFQLQTLVLARKVNGLLDLKNQRNRLINSLRRTSGIVWTMFFSKQRNITFNCFTFLTQKQLKGEPIEKFYGYLIDNSLNCDLGSHEESTIRNIFIANMHEGEIQRELLKKTRTAKTKKPLELATNIKMGIQNKLKVLGTETFSVSNQITNTSINSIQNSWNRPKSTTNNYRPTNCPNSGYAWSASHRQNCPARGKNCKNCGITNHFTKVFRKSKNQMKPKSSVSNIDDVSSEVATIGTSATVEE